MLNTYGVNFVTKDENNAGLYVKMCNQSYTAKCRQD